MYVNYRYIFDPRATSELKAYKSWEKADTKDLDDSWVVFSTQVL